MTVAQAQDELSAAYVHGAPGVAVSGLAWLAAGATWAASGPERGFVMLAIGGVLIFPLSLLVARFVFRAPSVANTNPLARLGFETTVPLFAGLLIAWLLLIRAPPLAFATFAMIVGARYFAFATLYRDRAYWLLGGVIFAIAYVYAVLGERLPLNVVLATGIVELVFAAVLFGRRRRSS